MQRPPPPGNSLASAGYSETIPYVTAGRTEKLSMLSLIRSIGVEPTCNAAVLVLAVVLGAFLRFSDLSMSEMSADEGASWAAARAPSISKVLEIQPRLNPGKFAAHELVLHGWNRLFGDSLTAMRSLSALAGTLGVIATFILTQELLALKQVVPNGPRENVAQARPGAPSSRLAGAIAALLFAVNLVFIKYAQEARMYSVALLFGLIQIASFLRSTHRPSPAALLITSVFTSLAIACTFTMLLILVPEALWLAHVARAWRRVIYGRVALAGLALMSGLVWLIPLAVAYLHERAQAPALIAYAWASEPPIWAPISMFNKAVGSIAFPVVLVLALWGTVQTWRVEHAAAVFALLLMLAPPIVVLSASYLLRPAFVERYMLASFVPFFVLVAFGISSMRAFRTRLCLTTLVTMLALGHVYSYRRQAHDVQWREAAHAAARTNGSSIMVAPPYAADVVRYYLRDSPGRRAIASGYERSATAAIVAESGVSPAEAARIAATFPRLLMSLRGVIVRGQW